MNAVGSHGESTFSFVRNFQTVFQSSVCVPPAMNEEFLLFHIVVLSCIWAILFNTNKFLPLGSCWSFNFFEGRKQQMSITQKLLKMMFLSFYFCQNRNPFISFWFKRNTYSKYFRRASMKYKINIPIIQISPWTKIFSDIFQYIHPFRKWYLTVHTTLHTTYFISLFIIFPLSLECQFQKSSNFFSFCSLLDLPCLEEGLADMGTQ